MRLLLLAACSAWACSAANPKPGPSPLIEARPYEANIPASYKGQPTPLLILLHGFGQNGFVQNAYFGLTQLSEDQGILLAFPDGTRNSNGMRFWNATDGCCDFEHSGVDDVAYVNAVIDDMERQYNVDKQRIYLTGHSNGGFMSHRMACESPTRIAAIASLAGATWKDTSKCKPSSPVAVLEIHGDGDLDVPYQGDADIPSAAQTVGLWATYNRCDAVLHDNGETKDLDFIVDGAETHLAGYQCGSGAAELWTMKGVGHLPNVQQPDWGNAIWSFLGEHTKP